MTIGTSHGLYYPDEMSFLGEHAPKNPNDNNVIDPSTKPDLEPNDDINIPKPNQKPETTPVVNLNIPHFESPDIEDRTKEHYKVHNPTDRIDEWNTPFNSKLGDELAGGLNKYPEKDFPGRWNGIFGMTDKNANEIIHNLSTPMLHHAQDILDKQHKVETQPQKLAGEDLPDINDVPHHDWVEDIAGNLGNEVLNAFTLPGDVYAGKVDPMSEEGIHRATDLAAIATATPGREGLGSGVRKYQFHDTDEARRAAILESKAKYRENQKYKAGTIRANNKPFEDMTKASSPTAEIDRLIDAHQAGELSETGTNILKNLLNDRYGNLSR